MSLVLAVLGLLELASASSDGWTPIIPDSGTLSGRHAVAVEPGLPGGIGSTAYLSHVDHVISSGGHHSHAYRPHRMPPHSLHGDHPDTCALYKAAMTQDLYFQYIQYKVHLPDLKEFTLCMWHKFYNHSSDHPLFSYAVRDTPRAILSWVSSTDRSTYFSMSVDGHTLYRLNYPLRLNRWYHSCQSWNGRTGEWQVWVNAERVGRGFHNLLVKHVIKGGGVAITGQEQRQFGGGFLEGEGAPKGAGGMLGEITQLQMYSVALTAGKAYRDHKHHHGNYGSEPQQPPTTTAAPQPESTTLNPYAPFLTNGQLTPQLPIFELSAFRKNVPMPPMDDAGLPAHDPSAAAPAVLDLSQLLGAQGGAAPAVSYVHMTPTAGGSPVRIPLLSHHRPALDLDDLRQQHYVFKRDDQNKGLNEQDAPSPLEEASSERKPGKRETSSEEIVDDASFEAKKDTVADEKKTVTKREAPSQEKAPTKTEQASDAKAVDEPKKEKREVDAEADAEVDAAAAAADVESQRIVKRQPVADPSAAEDKAPKREGKRMKATRSRSSPKRKDAEPKPEQADAKRDVPRPAQDEDAGATDKKKRQTISLGGGALDLGTGDIDTSLLTRGLSHGSSLSGLLSHGDLHGTSYSSLSHPAGAPVTTFYEFHGNHQQLLPASPSKAVEKEPPPLKKETEPAEGEVMAVMNMCSGCSPDPFSKVNVISWQGTPKKLYSGVLYLKANPICRKF